MSVSDNDLFPFKSILVSTGPNKNDDIFTQEELIAARKTPIHKMVDLHHDREKVIGHIVDSVLVDDDYVELLDLEDLPQSLHIMTRAVIYRHPARNWAELEGSVNDLIAEIQEGDKWFVSMEAFFDSFDFGVLTAEGEVKVIPRNAETQWMTNHLRTYGGTGKVENYRVGRVLRNINFGGMALTKFPANDKSVILGQSSLSSSFLPFFANCQRKLSLLQQDISLWYIEAVRRGSAE